MPVPGILVVTQAEYVHAEIALLLDDLRAGLTGAKDQDSEPEPGQADEPDEDEIVTRFYPQGDPERAAALGPAVTEFVAPETWTEGTARLSIVGGTLVVRQSRRVHSEIEQFLERLDESERGRTTRPRR